MRPNTRTECDREFQPREPRRAGSRAKSRRHGRISRGRRVVGLAVMGMVVGCGTTRVTDTQRTATEQLLVSNAIDQAVTRIDFRALAGKPVFFDPQYLDGATDRGYLVSSLRQHLLASGCRLQEDRARATYVVEARSGGVGTDRHELLFGVPQMNVPALVPGQPSQIPEIPLAKKTDQKGVAKVAVFAYNRITGRPVWQSGVAQAMSSARDTWLLGAGPFQRGTIRNGTEFAGQQIQVPLLNNGAGGKHDPAQDVLPVTHEAVWAEPPMPRSSVTRLAGQPTGGRVVSARPATSTVLRDPAVDPVSGTTARPAAPPAPVAPAMPNAGGQSETAPASILDSGTGFKPDIPANAASAGTGPPVPGAAGTKPMGPSFTIPGTLFGGAAEPPAPAKPGR